MALRGETPGILQQGRSAAKSRKMGSSGSRWDACEAQRACGRVKARDRPEDFERELSDAWSNPHGL